MILIQIIYPGEVWIRSFLSFLAADCEIPISKRCIYSNPDVKGGAGGRRMIILLKFDTHSENYWTACNSHSPVPEWLRSFTAMLESRPGHHNLLLHAYRRLCSLCRFTRCRLSGSRWSWDPNSKADSQTLDTPSEIGVLMRPPGKSCVYSSWRSSFLKYSLLQGIVYLQYIKLNLVLKATHFHKLKTQFQFLRLKTNNSLISSVHMLYLIYAFILYVCI